MKTLNNFKDINGNVKDSIIDFDTNIVSADNTVDIEKKIKKIFSHYQEKSDFEKLEETIEHANTYLQFDNSVLKQLQQSLISTAIKENKEQLVLKYITQYNGFTFSWQDFINIRDNDNSHMGKMLLNNNLVTLENEMKNVKFSSDSFNVCGYACEMKNLHFFKLPFDLPNPSLKLYTSAIMYAVEENWIEAIDFVVSNYKDKIPQEKYEKLIVSALEDNNETMANYLKSISPYNNVSATTEVPKKIKKLREKNIGKNNTDHVLKK